MADVKLSLNFVAIAALATSLAATSASAAGGCMTADESAAEHVRRLQTTLMVGALQCRARPELEVTANYNKFVERFGATVAAQNKILTRYFQRTYGGNYQTEMDREVTAMANGISRIAHTDGGFCETVAAIGRETLAPKIRDLVELAQWRVVAPSKLATCEPIDTRTVQNTIGSNE